MKHLTLLLLCVAFGVVPSALNAQDKLFGKDFTSAKLLFIDHGNPNGIDSLNLTNGLEVAYRRNFSKYLSLAIPMKFAQADIHNDINKRNFFSIDGLVRLQYYDPEHVLVPYLLGGFGYVVENKGENNTQIPMGLGLDIRVGRSSYLNLQGEYRISSAENRNNVQAGLGFTYRLGDKKPDADQDGIPDDDDQCPQIAGMAKFMGCPDTDMDGIPDMEDGCPQLAGPAASNGCPDSDGDGIIDNMDDCPEEAGSSDNRGCPDSDEDGLIDKVDNCPNEYGTLEGCPDQDGDGIADIDDDCPAEPGALNNNGCPIQDRDGDGFADEEDECPDEAGPIDGCPDSDGDGIIDREDDCPQQAGIETNDGCPAADFDDDGFADEVDECPNTPGTVNGCPDSDGDGIMDREDDCPQEIGAESNRGCPVKERDGDGDGFADDVDDCPGQAGTIDGCPDSDEDGIIDSKDDCPEEAGLVVNNGCPLPDSDGDGFADEEDECPDEAGTIDGCPDSDEDGIIDSEDDCPEEAGLMENNGCPTNDMDGDGFINEVDKCPKVAGAIDGCPDSDMDGVIDIDDACPQIAGELNGCPDEDGDGVADPFDVCPREAGPSENKGCPLIKQEDQDVLNYAMRTVRFETGSAKLTADSYDVLDQIVVIMNRYPSYTMFISGHTDSRGEGTNNLILSLERARSCFQYLLANGVEASRMNYEGYGESEPIADNDSSTGRRLNRRVEFDLRVR